MKILLDTNILLRISEPAHSHHSASVSALRTLALQGHSFCIASQTISEFLAVATRPVVDRGLGMAQAKADEELTKVISSLEMLYDSKAVIDELRRFVVLHSISGKSVHDAHLVAAMNANAVSHLLTINTRDFNRYTNIHVLDPMALEISP
jgi:predicted nucleic acid-binding protein